jgi:coiled-coil domain-containing protein 61
MASDTYYIQFHGIQYVLSLLVASSSTSSGKTLLVDIEQEESGARWTGEFAAKYVEDITQKTGNYKRFSVFVNMLRKSLDNSGNNSVFVDLLTTADLNELKQRRSGKSKLNDSSNGSRTLLSTSSSSTKNNGGKRYLILTYTAEFDKVHYPLPLAYEEHPSPATLQRTISRLRRERANGGRSNSNSNSGSSIDVVDLQRQLHVVRAENEALRRNKGNAAAVEARIAFQKYRETSEMVRGHSVVCLF